MKVLALRPREAAKALSISPRLLWQLTDDGQVPCVRVGTGRRRAVLYPMAELEAWLSHQAQGAVRRETCEGNEDSDSNSPKSCGGKNATPA